MTCATLLLFALLLVSCRFARSLDATHIVRRLGEGMGEGMGEDVHLTCSSSKNNNSSTKPYLRERHSNHSTTLTISDLHYADRGLEVTAVNTTTEWYVCYGDDGVIVQYAIHARSLQHVTRCNTLSIVCIAESILLLISSCLNAFFIFKSYQLRKNTPTHSPINFQIHKQIQKQ